MVSAISRKTYIISAVAMSIGQTWCVYNSYRFKIWYSHHKLVYGAANVAFLCFLWSNIVIVESEGRINQMLLFQDKKFKLRL